MDYNTQVSSQFGVAKMLAEQAFEKNDLNHALESIANAAIIAVEKMPGTFCDNDLESLFSKIGKAVCAAEQPGQPDNAPPVNKCDVLLLASTISYVGGHSEMIRQWIRFLASQQQRLAFFNTELIQSPFKAPELTELIGDADRVHYANSGSFVERVHELIRFVEKTQPAVIVMFINPHDAIAAAACSTLKGRIPLVYVNHADHLFWLGNTIADLVVEYRRYGAYYTLKERNIRNIEIVNLTSQLVLLEKDREKYRADVRSQFHIPAAATLSLSITTTYKILGSAWSYLETIVEMLQQHRDHHHMLILNSGREEFLQYLNGSGVEDRFHIVGTQNNLVPFYQAADLMIETFPYKGGMVRYDAFKAGLPTVVVENTHMPEHTEIQGLPKEHPVVTDRESLLKEAGALIRSPKLRASRSKMIRRFYSDHFSEKAISEKIKTLLENVQQGASKSIELKGFEPPPADNTYFQRLDVLSEADVAFYSGQNAEGLRIIQPLLVDFTADPDVAAVLKRLKYNHVGLPFGLQNDYAEAIMAKERGDAETAQKGFENLIRKHPTFGPAYVHLGECRMRAGKVAEAVEALQKAAIHASDKQQKAEAFCTIAKYRSKAGHYLRAAAAYEEALEALPEQPQIIYWLAEALVNNRQNERADRLLQEILSTKKAPKRLRQQAEQLRSQIGHAPEDPLKNEALRVSVIIPVFNKVELTRNCIETMFALPPEKTPFEVLIVDNGSTDGTAEYLTAVAKRYPRIRIISNPKNLGFSRACNVGAAAASGEYLHFLNNDTEPKQGWLDQLVTVLDRDAEVVAVGSKLLFPNGNLQHAGVVSVESRRSGDPLILFHNYYNTPGNDARVNEMMEYTALTAASMMVRKPAFELVEGFDEEYWNGYEDVDLCFKFHQRGWKLVYQPASVLVHYESQSGPERFTKVKENIQRLHQRWLGVIEPDYVFYGEGHKIKTGCDRIRPYRMPARRDKVRIEPPKDALTSIIILTYNQLDKTRECLDSLEKYTTLPYEVIVVDNGSKDGTRKFLKSWEKKDPHHTVILNPQNKGFAGGNNQGIRKAKGEYLVLLNNDTVVTGGWLEGLLLPFQIDETVGLVGPKSNFVAGAQYEPHTVYQNEIEMQAFAGDYRKLFCNRVKEHHRLVGFCLAIKKAVIVDVGFLDERFGKGNYEDDDFSLRATIAGYKLVIAEDTFIHHYGNSSFKANKIDYLKSLEKNRQIFLDKWEHLETNEPILMDILFEEARLRQEVNEHAALELVLRKILKLDPRNKRAAEALFKLLTESERHEEALSSLEAYATVNPGDHEAQNALGMQYWESDAIEKAIAHFQLAMESAPNKIDYLKNFADANIAIEHFEAGVQMLTHIIQEFPTDPEAYIKLANLYVEDGNLNAAQQWLIQGRQYNQESPELQNALVAIQQLASSDINSSNVTK